MNILKAGIFANPHKDAGLEGACLVAQRLRVRGIEVSFDLGGMPDGETVKIDYEDIDCLFVLGGDGTLLKAALKCSCYGVCMLGINLGRLGFLTEVELDGIDAAIDAMQNGKCYVEERMMLRCAVYSGETLMFETDALNDAVISKKDVSRMIGIELCINGAIADNVSCDGILIATPTGSTGYSLSAGGPIVSPQLECIMATPICPHSLHSRTLVTSADDEIIIRATAIGGMVLTTDGVMHRELQSDEIVKIKRSQHLARFVRFQKDYFYPLLRSKFVNWDR